MKMYANEMQAYSNGIMWLMSWNWVTKIMWKQPKFFVYKRMEVFIPMLFNQLKNHPVRKNIHDWFKETRKKNVDTLWLFIPGNYRVDSYYDHWARRCFPPPMWMLLKCNGWYTERIGLKALFLLVPVQAETNNSILHGKLMIICHAYIQVQPKRR